MSAIKTPVRLVIKWGYCEIVDADGNTLAQGTEEDALSGAAMVAAINATLGIGLSVEALERGVVERAIALLRALLADPICRELLSTEEMQEAVEIAALLPPAAAQPDRNAKPEVKP